MHRTAVSIYNRIAPLPKKGGWVRHFNAKLYTKFNEADKTLLQSPAKAMMHFRTAGYRQLRQFSLLGPIDADFYTSFYDDLRTFDPISAYKHWLLHGIAEGRFHSSANLLQRIEWRSTALPPDLMLHLSRNAAGAPSVWRSIVSFFDNATVNELYALANTCSVETLKELFRYFTSRSLKPQADILCEILFDKCSSDPLAMHLMADRYSATGQFYSALRLYMRVMADNEGYSVWCVLNSIELLRKYGDFDAAVALCVDGTAKFPGNESLREHLRQSLLSRYDRALDASKRFIIDSGSVSDARNCCHGAAGALDRGLDVLYADTPRISKRSAKSVAIIGHPEPPQCFEYRVRQKIEHLNALGMTGVFFHWNDCDQFLREVSSFDVVIFYRTPAFGSIIEALYVANKMGLCTVFEIDDLILDTDIYPPAYVTYGNMVSAEEVNSLRFDPILFSEVARRCRFGMASTASIAERLEQIVAGKKSFVVENGLFQRESAVATAAADRRPPDGATWPPDRITIFYGSGSRTHSSFFKGDVSEAILGVLRSNPLVDLAIIGPLTLDKRFDSLGTRIRRLRHHLSREEYLAELEKSSINLMPISDDIFSSAKSNIKWLEAAMLGIPTVASDNPRLRHSVRDDEIVFCGNAQEWRSRLGKLADSATLRGEIGSRARAAALARYAPAVQQGQLARFAEGVTVDAEGVKSARTCRTKVLMVNVLFAPQAYGGATRVVLDDAIHLVEAGIDVAVFTSIEGAQDNETFRLYMHEGILVCGVKAPQKAQAADETDPGVAAKFHRFVELFQPDIVHFHCIQRLSASLADTARWCRLPYIISIHDGWWISDDQFLMHPDGRTVLETSEWGREERLGRLRRCLEDAEMLLAVSETFKSLYSKRCRAEITVLENTIHPVGVTRRPGSRALRLGLIGGLGVAKGADLLKATLLLRSYGNLEFDIVDHLAEESTVRPEVWGDNRVRILGRFSQHRVAEFYNEIDVLLAPSLCVESFGLSVREALEAKRWVVVSDRGALSAAVEPERNGFVIDVGDPSDLGRVLDLMNSDVGRFKRDSVGLRVASPSPAERLDKLRRIYEEISDRRQGCRQKRKD